MLTGGGTPAASVWTHPGPPPPAEHLKDTWRAGPVVVLGLAVATSACLATVCVGLYGGVNQVFPQGQRSSTFIPDGSAVERLPMPSSRAASPPWGHEGYPDVPPSIRASAARLCGVSVAPRAGAGAVLPLSLSRL